MCYLSNIYKSTCSSIVLDLTRILINGDSRLGFNRIKCFVILKVLLCAARSCPG